MIYKVKFFNQDGKNVRWGEINTLFTDLKCNNNPILYCDKIGLQKHSDKIWFELFEYNSIFKKFDLFFAGMNF